MTYSEFKAYAVKYLPSNCLPLETDILILHFSGLKKSELLLRRGEQIPLDILDKLLDAVKRRSDGEPLQYIIGEWDFFGLRMFCGKGCLIPRPETEQLAELVIERLPIGGHFLDLCTGSGCISIAILNNRADVTGTAVDISEDALFYAKKNSEYHGVSDRLELIKSDIFEYEPFHMPDILLSNPPYIKSSDISKLQREVQYEPREALDGGHDGLDFYKVIAKRYIKYIQPKGSLFFEVGYDIACEVAAILRFYKMKTQLIKDIQGISRICIGEKEE